MPKTRWNLESWRDWAFEAARAKGARRACHLCKRAMMGCGSVEIRPPWRTSRGKVRSLCALCWRELTEWIDTQEYERNSYHEGIDWVQSSNLK